MKNPIKMDDLGVPLFLEHPFGEDFSILTVRIFFQMGQDFTQRDGDFEGFPENNSAWSLGSGVLFHDPCLDTPKLSAIRKMPHPRHP